MYSFLFRALLPFLLITLGWFFLGGLSLGVLLFLFGFGTPAAGQSTALVLMGIAIVVLLIHRLPETIPLVRESLMTLTLHLVPSRRTGYGPVVKVCPDELLGLRSQWRFVRAVERLTISQKEIYNTLQADSNNAPGFLENLQAARLLSPEKGPRVDLGLRDLKKGFHDGEFWDRSMGEGWWFLAAAPAVALLVGSSIIPALAENANRPMDEARIAGVVMETVGEDNALMVVALEDETYTVLDNEDYEVGEALNLYTLGETYSASSFNRPSFGTDDVVVAVGVSLIFGTLIALVFGGGLFGTFYFAVPLVRKVTRWFQRTSVPATA